MNEATGAVARALGTLDVERLLADLVAIPSHPEAPGAEGPIAAYVADFFHREGMGAELYDAEPGRPNVEASLAGASPGPRLAFCGHLDTVPPYDMEEPYRPLVREGCLYGRGSVDMKAGVAAALAAMAALRRSGLSLGGEILFAGVADEELGSAGARALVSRPGFRADAAIVGEPTGLSVCLGHRGLEWFTVDFEGRTVHGGDQENGISAIDHAARFVVDLRDELAPALGERRHILLGPSTVNVGTIRGGTQPSTVAGSCSLSIDRRFLPSERYEDVVAELTALAERRMAAAPGLRASVRVMDSSLMPGGFVHQPALVDEAHPLVAACRSGLDAAAAREGASGAAARAGLSAFPAWSDAGILAHYGRVPAVVWGPGELSSAHSRDERVELAQVRDCALAYALAALAFCSPGHA